MGEVSGIPNTSGVWEAEQTWGSVTFEQTAEEGGRGPRALGQGQYRLYSSGQSQRRSFCLVLVQAVLGWSSGPCTC